MSKFKVGDWVVHTYSKKAGKIDEIGEHDDIFPFGINFSETLSWECEQDLDLVEPLDIRYLNYKGVQSWRKVIPLNTKFASSPYHNDGKPTWLLEAWDLDKDALRCFQMKDILEIGKEF